MSLPTPVTASIGQRCARVAAALGLFAAGLAAQGQEIFTVLTNGPAANRVNIVILAEGYTQAELTTFRTDATNSINALLAHPPFSLYKHMFNGYGIAVASNESGSDHPSRGVYRDTYFNSSYDSFGTTRLITIPPNNFDASSIKGTRRVTALLNQFMPQWDLVMLLVNDTEYGGSGGSTLIASKHSSAAEIARHEMGHTFAKLGDEYTTPYPGYPNTEEPNTTRETNRNNIKWKAWLQSSTPTPTPATSAYGSVIGLFQGAHYNTTGWYRPKLDCKMRTLDRPFCEVCSETLLTAAYGRVNPIGEVSPAVTNLTTTGDALAFDVNPLVPSATRTLQWSVNNVNLNGQTGTSLALTSAQLVQGTNFVRCIVRDITSLVRNDPKNSLQGMIEWRVVLDGVSLRMDAPVWLGGGRLAIKVTGYAPKGVILQASSDFNNWTDISIHGPVDGELSVTNIIPSSINAVGFRAVTTE